MGGREFSRGEKGDWVFERIGRNGGDPQKGKIRGSHPTITN